MSSQRTSPASFSRLKEVLPTTQPLSASAPDPVILEPVPILAEAAPPVEPIPAAVPPIQQSRIQQPYIPPAPIAVKPAAVQQPVSVSDSRSRSVLAARPGKRLQHTKPATFRLPIELIETLKDVAQHNNLNMTDIVAEAVWLHLDSFEWPSGLDPTRELLAAHFAAPPRR